VFIKERLIVSRERSGGKGVSYSAGAYFLSKLAAELPFTALFPCLFGALVYPLAGLQASPARFLRFLGTLILESYAAAGLGMVVGCIVSATTHTTTQHTTPHVNDSTAVPRRPAHLRRSAGGLCPIRAVA
jgi:hypothetical protein